MNRKSCIRRILLSVSFVLLVSCGDYPGQGPNSTVKHTFIQDPFASVIWSKDNIMTFIDQSTATLVSAPNRIIALGIQPKKLYSFDSLTGELSWEKNGIFPNALATHNSTVYLADSNNFTAYNTLDGKKIFDTLLPYSGLFTSINFDEDRIFMRSANDSFFVLDIKGNVVKSTGPNIYPMPYIVANEVTYSNNIYGIIATNTQTGDLLWQANIPEEGYYSGPYFLDDNIYLRTGSSTVPGSVYAIDKDNGEILWRNDSDAISNLCSLGGNLYFLTWDGYLMALDQETGTEVIKLEFSPRPFILPTAEWRLGGYYVVSDPTNNIVAVSLGDSYQLFALKINNP